MTQVVFSHRETKEKKYLNQLLEEKAWFESENFNVFLPKNDDLFKTKNGKKRDALSKKIIWLKTEWGKIKKDYFKTVKKFKHKRLHSIYECHVSRFGPEGKYTRPNILFIRLRTNRDRQRVMETIGHELLHLLFADIFESEKLNYAEREGMVDALILRSDLANVFPQYKKQSIGKVRKKLLKSILQ